MLCSKEIIYFYWKLYKEYTILIMSSVDIGVLGEKCSGLLHPRFYPSKIGGKPAWLDLKNLPNPEQLICKVCNKTLVFLCQIYAPYEQNEDCFHRTIFIFICRNGSCCQSNRSDNFLVLRCQLPRQNEYYSYEPYEEIENGEFPMDKWPRLCDLCGIRALFHCGNCKRVFYCSRNHQVLDWQKGHKENCKKLQSDLEKYKNNFIVTEAGKSVLFKEWELLVNEEDQNDVTDVNVDHEMAKLQKIMQEKTDKSLVDVSENELEQYTKPLLKDKMFNKFSKRVARHPDQVLRYDRGGNPLWITTIQHLVLNIPNCQYCNGERQFEFQIMPQLLNFIDVGIDVNSIDWGILAVYTCTKSCSIGPAYKIEFMMKQDLVA